MALDEIIRQILSTRQDLTREEILKRIEEKKVEAGGYFTNEGAALLVASELGVEIPREPLRPEVLIRDIVSGLNDVTVTGRVITFYSPKAFTRRDGTDGRVARLLIADRSGALKVALWDEKAGLVEEEEIERGQIIRVSHGYVREGLNGKPELHVGLRGDIQVSPLRVVDHEYPSGTRFLQKIGEIKRGDRGASLLGVIHRVYPVSTFERRNGTRGKVRRLRLKDETGRITVVFWNNKVDELGDVKRGDYLQIMDVRIREDPDGRLEAHTRDTTQVERLPERPTDFGPLLTRFMKIEELKSGMRDVDVLARVAHVGGAREFARRSGGKGRVSTLLISDETGLVNLNLWEDKAALSMEIQPGDVVLVERAYPRERFGRINLNLGKRGTLTLNPEVTEGETPPPYKEKVTTIAEVREEGGPITVEGVLETAPQVREVITARGERVDVASFELSDETGTIRVSLWRGLAETVIDLTVGTRIKIRNAYVRRGLADQLELTSRVLTSIRVLPRGGRSIAQRS